MISEVISFLRFIRDPEIREAVSRIYRVLGRNQQSWTGNIKTLRAAFKGDESYRVSAFANHTIEQLKSAGIVPGQIEKFRIVFGELIRNAFEHGCRNSRRCRVSVRCTYCQWFIRLQITDSGKGFDLPHFTQRSSEWLNCNEDRHGLWVVSELTDSLSVNKAGNSVTAFLLASARLKVIPVVQKYKYHEILILNVDNGSTWDYMAASWEPLVEALENVRQKLIIINCEALNWSSDGVSQVRDAVGEFKANLGWFYAFVVDRSDSKLFNLKKFESENIKVFETDEANHITQINNAKKWLVQSDSPKRF